MQFAMQPRAFFAWCLTCAMIGMGQAFGAQSGASHPIEKVIVLLKDLGKKVDSEGKDEEVTYAKFEKWCADSFKNLEKSISEEKETIDSLDSKVDAKQEQEKSLTKKIDALTEEIKKSEVSGADAKTEREEAAKLYEKADKDLETTIKAIDDAITALKDAKAKTDKLLQLKLKALLQLPLVLEQVEEDRRGQLLSSLLTSDRAEPREDILAMGDAAKHEKKYSFKSGNVIELLKELKQKFEDDRLEATKEETNAQNAYDLAKNARESALEAAKDSKKEKTTLLGEVQTDLEEAKSTLKNTKEDLKADESTLMETKKTCNMKASEWKERTDLRTKEMEAIEAAIKILAKASGVRTEAPKNPTLPTSPLKSEESLLFLQTVDPKQRALNLLREEARKAHSRTFEQFAEELAAHMSAPFDEINQMIQKMVFRLMAEQKDEDEHKNWCDLEMEKTNTSKTHKEEKIDSLQKKLDEADTDVAKLTDDIEKASGMIAKVTAHMEEATEIRNTGKKENKKAIKDAKQAQAAITEAISVLETYYKESGMTAFLQRDPVNLPESPSTWDASYTGVADPKKQPSGIITVLKEVSADFAKMEADTEAQENLDQKEFEEEMKSCEIEKARRNKESDMKEQEKKRTLAKIDSMEKSQKHTSDELDSVVQYIKDLQPACVEGDSTYEKRKEARQKEIDALKKAQVILADAFKKEEASASFLSPARRLSRK